MRWLIKYRRYALLVRVLGDPAEVYNDRADDQAAPFDRFRVEWERWRTGFGAPACVWAGRERVIIRRLLEKWGLDRLVSVIEHFWAGYSRPVFEGRAEDQILLFAAAVPQMMADTANETTRRDDVRSR